MVGWMDGSIKRVVYLEFMMFWVVLIPIRKPEIIMIVIGSVQVFIVCGHRAQLGLGRESFTVSRLSPAGLPSVHP